MPASKKTDTKKKTTTSPATQKTDFIPYDKMTAREKQAFKQGSNAKENQFKDRLGIWRPKKQD